MRRLRPLLRSAALMASLALPISSEEDARAYLIGSRDLLSIKVFEASELNVERRVRSDGTIELPLLGELSAKGESAESLADLIQEKLEASFLQRASVTVEVVEVRSAPIRVVGAVEQPGELALTGPITLLEVLSEARGLSAGRGSVTVVRRAENGLSDQLDVKIDDLLTGDLELWNVPIFANDLIKVPPESSVTVYLLGEVGTKGAIEFPGGARPTLLSALARAGGLTERAVKKVLVKRQARDGTLEEIEAHYERILDGKDPDLALEDGDLIVVRRSFL